MLEVLKLRLLQPLLSSTKRSWRPMTVGCIRWCLLQVAQRKMRNGIVDIFCSSSCNCSSVNITLTKCRLSSHPEGIKPFEEFRTDCIGNEPTHRGNLTEGMLTGVCWFRNITAWLCFKLQYKKSVS